MRAVIAVGVALFLAGCASRPQVALSDVHFAEKPYIVQRGENYYLHYRVALGQGMDLLWAITTKKTPEKAYYYFLCRISLPERGRVVERSLEYDHFTEYAKRDAVFWLNPDGTEEHLHVVSESSFEPDNAAVSYLTAASMFVEPMTQAEITSLEFVDEKLFGLPREVLSMKPDVVELLNRESHIVEYLHSGTIKPKCLFDVDWSKGHAALLPHCRPIRRLARHACGQALLMEFNGKTEDAAQVYCDVARMGAHMGEGKALIEGLVGMHIQSLAFSRLEGLLAKDPDQATAAKALACLSSIPPRAFPLERYAACEAEDYVGWLLLHPDSWRQLPELEKVRDDTFTREEVLTGARYVRDNLMALAAVAKGPYYLAASELKKQMARLRGKIDETDKAMLAGVFDKPNILLGILLPDFDAIQVRIARTEAQLGMMQVLAAAVLYKADEGKYPYELKSLSHYFPAGLPMDPFTGNGLEYSLHDGLPSVACNVPAEVRQEPDYKPELFSYDIGRRRKADAEALRKFQDDQSARPDESTSN